MRWQRMLYILSIMSLTSSGNAETLGQPYTDTTNSHYSYPNQIHSIPNRLATLINKSELAERNYEALRDLLPKYQDAVNHPWPIVPAALYKLHAKNAAVILLRERLQASGDLPAYYDQHENVFDAGMMQAVKSFQERHGLKSDGIIGSNTLRELNVPPAVRLNQIEVNMQRWASLEAQLTNRFIMVNIPDFHLYVYDEDKQVLSLKAIVGKLDRETPELSSRVTRFVLNPYWNVPEMIAKKDIAPKVIHDPDYLDEMHIRIFSSQEDDATELSEDDVDWDEAARSGVPYHLRQDPGVDNALGLVKFEFQNSQDVYLHDTPAKNLFDQDNRMFSSGCVRLQDPFALVQYLMQPDIDWNDARMQTILTSGKTTYVKAARPMPIFITYLTAWVDEQGKLNFRDDIYHKDSGDDHAAQQKSDDDQEDDNHGV